MIFLWQKDLRSYRNCKTSKQLEYELGLLSFRTFGKSCFRRFLFCTTLSKLQANKSWKEKEKKNFEERVMYLVFTTFFTFFTLYKSQQHQSLDKISFVLGVAYTSSQFAYTTASLLSWWPLHCKSGMQNVEIPLSSDMGFSERLQLYKNLFIYELTACNFKVWIK